MSKVVYVQSADVKPLMPTKRFGKVRRMLKDKRAVCVKRKPFTIRLTYETTSYTQEVVSGTDGGRTNIGNACVLESGECLYRDRVKTRNKEVPKLMKERREHRQASRRGERFARKRLAKKNGTLMKKGEVSRILPGYEKPVIVKDIINTPAKFNHRVRSEGWLTPTATQLLQTLVNHEKQMREILPVTKKVIEINKFAFMKLNDPKTYGQDFCYGPMHEFTSQLEVISKRQGDTCFLCGGPIEHIHHVQHSAKGGSDTIANKVGLCEECHRKIHTDVKAEKELLEKAKGEKKKYAGTSIWNQVFPYYVAEMEKLYPGQVYLTNGWDTKKYRENYHLNKDHDLDAYAIACSILENQRIVDTGDQSYLICQFRRHDRALIYAQKQRTYYLGKEKVAVNRKRAIAQKEFPPSLNEWYREQCLKYGEKEAKRQLSRLTIRKSTRSYNNPRRFMPGALFEYEGQRYILASQKNKGIQFKGIGMNKYVSASKCKILRQNTGLVYL